jgi:hypothetical protein
MASSWLTSWLSSWGNSWGPADVTPTAQTGGAGYFVDGPVKKKKKRRRIESDVIRAYQQLTEKAQVVEQQIEAVVPEKRTYLSLQDTAYLGQLQAELARLYYQINILQQEIEEEDDIELILMSLPFMG